jgi:phosphopantothenoylcysteine decarboxylase/phosphopantothenate--cysteine ligase
MLNGRRICVGLSGGIAAYKGAELVRLLVKEGATVQVVLTRAAEEFVTRLTLQTLSGRPVGTDLFDLDQESKIGHIRIADEAELLVIAPATAHLIARLAAGLADDLLTTVALATRAPILIAPAMNVNMWEHPATRDNLATLVGRGVHTVGPDAGGLACGWIGPGRLIEPPEIVAACARLLGPRDLDGVPILITAGPTHEAVDPVRYVANRSTGKMGFALARRAAARGARVTLVAGPVALPTPPGVERVDVTTAREMREAVLSRDADVSCVIKAAAVADFRPAIISEDKIKKGDADTLTMVLERNPDILTELSQRKRARGGRPILVGFAAEVGDVTRWAEEKLARKGCDLLVANDVSRPDAGFASDQNRVTLFAPSADPEEVPLQSKDSVADHILDRVRALLP